MSTAPDAATTTADLSAKPIEGESLDAPLSAPPQQPLGRIPILDVTPCVDHGARPAKSVVGEPFEVTATVFREGHDALGATVVLTDPDGAERMVPMTCPNPGLSHWVAEVAADREGLWRYRVEGWSDPWGTWVHDASIKVGAGIDTELMLAEGVRVLRRALETTGDVERDETGRRALEEAIGILEDTAADPLARLEAVLGDRKSVV